MGYLCDYDTSTRVGELVSKYKKFEFNFKTANF